jgi:hypothetical protein
MKKRQIIGEAAAKSEFDEPPTATISTTVRQRPDRNKRLYIKDWTQFLFSMDRLYS